MIDGRGRVPSCESQYRRYPISPPKGANISSSEMLIIFNDFGAKFGVHLARFIQRGSTKCARASPSHSILFRGFLPGWNLGIVKYLIVDCWLNMLLPSKFNMLLPLMTASGRESPFMISAISESHRSMRTNGFLFEFDSLD